MTDTDPDNNGPAFWDEKYAGEDYFFGTRPNAYLHGLHHAGKLPKGGRVLVPADGEGRNGVWLAEQGYDVTAVDCSPRALEKARKLAEDRSQTVTFIEADLRTWEWPVDTFDLVAALFIHFPPKDRPNIHRAMLGALKPGGTLVFEGFTPDQLNFDSGGPPDPEKLYTDDMLRADFHRAEILQLEEGVRDLDEGFLEGPGAVVELLARKPA